MTKPCMQKSRESARVTVDGPHRFFATRERSGLSKQEMLPMARAAALAALVVGIAGSASAQQFDAPYYELEKKHAAKWAEEDKAIDAKLAALEKKFGKEPNIIYILTDDIGYGELGVQGGGATHPASVSCGTTTLTHLSISCDTNC